MATKSDGQVVIEIVADDKKLDESLNKSYEKTAQFGNELQRVDQLLKLDPKNVILVTQKQELLTKEIQNTKEKLNLLAEAQRHAQEQFEKGEVSEEQYRSLQREIVSTEQTLKELTKQQADFQQELDGTEKSVAELGETSKDTTSKVAAMGASCTALCAGLVAVGAIAVKASTEFGSSFAKTRTIMDENAVSAARMRQEIMALSSLSGMKGATVSEAVYQAISGSVATEDATAFVDKANKLAVSGFTSLSNATDVLTTTLNAYGLEAENVNGISNVLIQTQNLGKTSVDELAASMGKAISTGSAYGVNLENLSTAYVELTRGGIATAEATTYISAMLNELGDVGSKVGGIIQEKTGKSFGQLMAEGASLGDVLQILAGTVNGDAEALMGLWSSQEAGKASNAIMTQGIEDFNEVLAQMGAEMLGATGTTEKAYETMTETSDFIDRRFRNSVNNLGVAFGDNLSPAVDWVKKSLTSVVETATGWVEKSPAVTAIITGMTLGIGALGIALAACSLKTKLATSETWKLTAAMMSNPFVLLVTGITTLITSIGAYAAASAAATDETEKLTVSSERQKEELVALQEEYQSVCKAQGETSAEAQVLKEKINQQTEDFENSRKSLHELDEEVNAARESYAEMSEQYEEAISGADKEYDSVTNLVDRLNELTSAEQASASAKQEILTIVDLLNEKLPELGLNYDSVKGKLNLSQDEILSAAKREVDQEKKTSTYTALKTALINDSEYEKVYLDAKAEWGAAKKANEEAQREFEAANAETLSHSEYERLADQAVAASNALDEAKERLDTARGTYYENQTAIDELSASLASYSEETQATVVVTETASQALEEAGAIWNSAADVLKAAYDEAYGKARESIEGQIGLFRSMKKETTLSIEGMMKSLDSQIAYMDEYAKNMQQAAEMGINQGLLQKLSDGSEESAGILAELVTMTGDQVEEMNEKFAKVSEGKDDFAEAMTEYTGVVEDEKQIMVDLAEQIGLDMSDALTRGLLDGYSAYRDAWLQYHYVGVSKPILGNEEISMYASGTHYADSGLALVGEAGPELMFLRGGERILTAEETQEVFAAASLPARTMSVVGAGAPSVIGNQGGQLHARIDVPLYLDGREFARASAEVMGEEMDWSVM